MPLMQDRNSEPRGVRTMRVALLAGAIGSLIGGTIVVASVATVLSVINPQPKQTSLTPKAPPVETTGVAPPAPQVAAADDRNDCANQTWPNIEQRCLKRIDDADQQTAVAADNPAPAVAADNPATAPGPVPSQLQPGSPSVPAPVAALPSQTSQPAVAAAPLPSSVAAPHPAAAVQPAPPATQPAPVADAPAKKAAPAKPVRKAERVRRATQTARPSEDDDGKPAVATSSRSRSQPDDVVEPAPRGRAMARRSIEADDVVIERPRPPSPRLGFFGFLFGSDND